MTLPTRNFFDQLLIYMDLYQHAKIRLFQWFVLEKRLIKKSYNLIGWEDFGTYLGNKDFSKYGIYTGTQKIISIFVIEKKYSPYSKNWSLNFTINSKNLFLIHFWSIFPILRAKKKFFQKIQLCHAKTLNELPASYQNLEKIKWCNSKDGPKDR